MQLKKSKKAQASALGKTLLIIITIIAALIILIIIIQQLISRILT